MRTRKEPCASLSTLNERALPYYANVALGSTRSSEQILRELIEGRSEFGLFR
jgi:hypothetical protein